MRVVVVNRAEGKGLHFNIYHSGRHTIAQRQDICFTKHLSLHDSCPLLHWGRYFNVLRSCMNMVAQPCFHDISKFSYSELKSFAAGNQSMKSKTDRPCQWLLDRLLQHGTSINKYRVILHESWSHYFLPSWRLKFAEKRWIFCRNQIQWPLREGSFNYIQRAKERINTEVIAKKTGEAAAGWHKILF